MASKLKVAPIPSFVGGLNIYANASQVADNESPDLQNIEFFGVSGMRKRRGFKVVCSTPPATGHKIQGKFTYNTNSDVEVLCVSNGKLYKQVGVVWILVGGSFSATKNVNACQVGDRLYIADGESPLQYYNGSGLTTTGLTAAPSRVEQLIFYNKRIYCNSADNKDRFYYGAPLTSTGDSVNTGDFTADTDGGYYGFGSAKKITGFAKQGTSLYVFLENSISRIDPTSSGTPATYDHQETQISNSVGCRAPRSIDNVENDIFFVDSTIYSLGEVAQYATIRTKNVSAKISDIFDSMSQDVIKNASGIYYNKEQVYLLSIQATGSYNSTVIGYHVGYRAWVKWTGISANCFLDFTDSSGVKHLYFGSDNPTDGNVYELFQGVNDNGVAIKSYYKTKQFSFDAFHITKIFQDWNLDLGNVAGSITVYVYIDGLLADTVIFSAGLVSENAGLGTSVFGGLYFGSLGVIYPFGREGTYTETSTLVTNQSNTWRWHRLNSAPRGTSFQLVIENNNLLDTFEIKQASVAFIELPYRAKSSNNEI